MSGRRHWCVRGGLTALRRLFSALPDRIGVALFNDITERKRAERRDLH